MKILITGAAGFIGYHLSKRLLEKGGVEVIGFDNVNAYYDVRLKESRLRELDAHRNFTFVRGDLSYMDAVLDVFRQERPDMVVNLAAQAGVRYSIEHPRTYVESNIEGFFNLLEAIRSYPVKQLLFASSSSVYGNRNNAPFSINDPVDTPVSLYAATKKTDELMAYTYSHLYGIQATGLRFFTVYGPYGRPDMAYFKFTKRILSGEVIDVYNNGDLLRDFTYIDDVVDCVVRMLEAGPNGAGDGEAYRIYNIGNSKPEKLMDFIHALETAIGKKAEIRFLPMQPGDVYQTSADITETRRDFGFAPRTSIQEGLAKFYDWYRDYYQVGGYGRE